MNTTTRRPGRTARRIIATAGIGVSLALAGGAPAFAGQAGHSLPAVTLPPLLEVPPFELPELPEIVPTDDPTDPTDDPTDDPTEPAGTPGGPGDITSCEGPEGENVCDHDDPTDEPTEPTEEPVDPCEPTEPGDRVIDDLTAVIPMTDGGEFHITAEVAECTPTTGGGGGAPFTG